MSFDVQCESQCDFGFTQVSVFRFCFLFPVVWFITLNLPALCVKENDQFSGKANVMKSSFLFRWWVNNIAWIKVLHAYFSEFSIAIDLSACKFYRTPSCYVVVWVNC